MARFVVVVLVLVAVAFLANKYLLGEGDPRPGQADSAPADKSDVKEEPAADPGEDSTKAEAAAKNNLPDAADAANAVAAADAEKPVDPREAAAADAVAAADVETDLESEPGVEAKIDAPGAAEEVPPADPKAVEERNEEKLEAVEEKAK